MKNLTLGSLFDGIGGFPLCAALSGITPIWAAEVDAACVALTKQCFPDMLHYGDVSKINGADLPPVDIITFGSPCQDLSVAGKQTGIKNTAANDAETTRSGLFIDAIRIVYEMREATNGKYPKHIVWENVPGAFTSNHGRDFQIVLEEITKARIPIPGSGRWANAGMVRGNGITAVWRVLDAQYWGVPQRRKRIYLVGSFGSDCAGEILFKQDSVRRYLAPSGAQGACSGRCSDAGTERIQFVFDGRGNGNGQIAPAMTGDHNNRITDYSAIVLQSFGFHGWNSVTAAGVELRKEQAPTLTAKKQADALVKTVVCLNNDQGGNSIAVESGHVSPTLRALKMHGNLPIVAYGFPLGFRLENTRLYKDKATTICNGTRPGFCNGVVIGIDTYNQANTGNKAKTLLAGHQDADGLPCVVYAIDRAAFNQGENALYDFEISKSGISSTLVAKGPSAVAYALQGSMFGREDQNGPQGSGINKDVSFTLNTADRHAVAYNWCVRRLTPKECERLQGYPDDWTVLKPIDHMTDEEYAFYKSVYLTDKQIKGVTVKNPPTKEQLIKWHNKLDVDGARYKQLGNSLAIPCALRVIGYIADHVRSTTVPDGDS